MLLRSRRPAFSLVETVVVAGIIAVLLALVIAGVISTRAAAQRTECTNNLRQVGIALVAYHDQYKALPPGLVHPLLKPGVFPRIFGEDTDPYPFMTWQMRLLPHIGQDAIWKQILEAYSQERYSLTAPPHNGKYLRMPFLICAADGPRPAPPGRSRPKPETSSYLGVSGTNSPAADGLFFLDSLVRFAHITDGRSNTVAIGERPPSQDLAYGRWYGGWGPWGELNTYLGARETSIGSLSRVCLDAPYLFRLGRLSDPCSSAHFWSFHRGGGNFLFADGSVRLLSYTAGPMLPALATRAGGEAVTVAW